VFNPFKNFIVNLSATGPAAVLIVLVISITALGIFGQTEMAKNAMSVLSYLAGAVIVALTISK
jgi:hypothetical protein